MKHICIEVSICLVTLLASKAGASNESPDIYVIGTGNAPAIASDSKNHLHVVFERRRSDKVIDIFYSESSDGAKTWTSPKDIADTPGNSSRPDIAVEKGGGIDVVWTDTTTGETTPDIYFSRSIDGGKTWTKALDVSNTPGASTEPAIATGPNNSIHLIWTDTSKGKKSQDIYYCCSTDGGKTWAKDPLFPAVDISNTIGSSSQPAIAVGADGTVHSTWLDGTPGESHPDIYYAQNLEGTWNIPTNVSHSPRVSSHPSVACFKNKVVLPWSDNSTKLKAPDIWCAVGHTQEELATTKPLNISDTTGVSSKPAIAAGEKGNVAIVWKDTSNSEERPDIFARISNESSSEFTTVLDLTHSQSVSDRPDVTIAGDKMFAVWEDINIEAGKSTLKVTGMEWKGMQTAPAKEVSP